MRIRTLKCNVGLRRAQHRFSSNRIQHANTRQRHQTTYYVDYADVPEKRSLVRNFVKYWLIFKSVSSTDSAVNL